MSLVSALTVFNSQGNVYMSRNEGEELLKEGFIVVSQPMVANPENPEQALVQLTQLGAEELEKLNQSQAQPAVVQEQATVPVAQPVAPAVAPQAPAVAPAVVPAVQPVAIAQPVLDATVDVSQTGATPVPAATPNQTVAVDKDADGAVDFEIDTGVPIPTIKRGGNLKRREAKYPFDTLGEPTKDTAGNVTAAASFHVAPSTKMPEPWKTLASTVSAANKRNEVPENPPRKVQKEKRTLVKGANGKAALDANGKRQYTKTMVEEDAMVSAKKFVCRRVDENDPRGVGARVYRIL